MIKSDLARSRHARHAVREIEEVPRRGSVADLLVRMMNENFSRRSVPPGNYSFLPVSSDPSGVEVSGQATTPPRSSLPAFT